MRAQPERLYSWTPNRLVDPCRTQAHTLHLHTWAQRNHTRIGGTQKKAHNLSVHTQAHTCIRTHLEPLTHSHLQTQMQAATHSAPTSVSASAGGQRRWPRKAWALQGMPHSTLSGSVLRQKVKGGGRYMGSRPHTLTTLRLVRLPFPCPLAVPTPDQLFPPSPPRQLPAAPTAPRTRRFSSTLPWKRVGRLHPHGRKRGAAWLSLWGRGEGGGKAPARSQSGASWVSGLLFAFPGSVGEEPGTAPRPKESREGQLHWDKQ